MEQNKIIEKITSAQIHGYAQAALAEMAARNILPTPENYQLWYSYSATEDLSLVRAVDRLIENKTIFNQQVCDSLYSKYFVRSKEQSAVEKASVGLQYELKNIASTLKQAGDNTTEFSNSLSGHLNQIADGQDNSSLETLIQKLVTDTQTMKNRSKDLEGKLQKSSNEVKMLQQNLKSVQEEAITDSLTNIGNRKCFEMNLQDAVNDAENAGTTFSILMADVDHFKKFNDTWGHQMGDQVLKAVAHSLKTKIGEYGTPARFGGEEFVAILPKFSAEKAAELAEDIRNYVSHRVMRKKSTGETLGKITVSFGVATYHPGQEATEVLERADDALYLAKNSGRNCTRTEFDLKTQHTDSQIA